VHCRGDKCSTSMLAHRSSDLNSFRTDQKIRVSLAPLEGIYREHEHTRSQVVVNTHHGSFIPTSFAAEIVLELLFALWRRQSSNLYSFTGEIFIKFFPCAIAEPLHNIVFIRIIHEVLIDLLRRVGHLALFAAERSPVTICLKWRTLTN